MAVGEEVIVFSDVATVDQGRDYNHAHWTALVRPLRKSQNKNKNKTKDMKVLWGLDGNGREKRESGDECDHCVLYTCTSLPKDS